MPETPSTPEQRLLETSVTAEAHEPGWVRGEIRAHPAGGLTIGAMFLGMGIMALVVDTTANKGFGLFGLALAIVFPTFFLKNAGQGAKWDDNGVQFTWFGRPTAFVPWDECPHLGLAGKITTAKGREFSLPSTQGKNQSSTGDLVRAVMSHMSAEDPRQRKFRTPPPSERVTRVFRQIAWVTGLGSALALTSFLQHMRVLTEAGQWPPDMRMFFATLILGSLCIAFQGQVSKQRQLRRNPYLWKPAPLPWIGAWFAANTEIPPRKPDELVPGRLYAYTSVNTWRSSSPGEQVAFVLGLAATLALLFAIRDRGTSTVPMVVGTVAFALAYVLWQNFARSERKAMPTVDSDYVIEATDRGIFLWKEGVATAPLSYPRRLSVRLSKWLLGGDVEVWSDGGRHFAVDRRFMGVLLDDAPEEIRYAATEGAGWLHPESKAIAEQMLAERDWSKPLPKKGQ